jgi:hypothetical protein
VHALLPPRNDGLRFTGVVDQPYRAPIDPIIRPGEPDPYAPAWDKLRRAQRRSRWLMVAILGSLVLSVVLAQRLDSLALLFVELFVALGAAVWMAAVMGSCECPHCGASFFGRTRREQEARGPEALFQERCTGCNITMGTPRYLALLGRNAGRCAADIQAADRASHRRR